MGESLDADGRADRYEREAVLRDLAQLHLLHDSSLPEQTPFGLQLDGPLLVFREPAKVGYRQREGDFLPHRKLAHIPVGWDAAPVLPDPIAPRDGRENRLVQRQAEAMLRRERAISLDVLFRTRVIRL